MDGSIPAHAGKACRARVRSAPARVDPRARGEGDATVTRALVQRGRSPRTRGRLGCGLAAVQHVGSIPAHAGKAPAPHARRFGVRVDPRARGEGTERAYVSERYQGRSPRTRGRPGGNAGRGHVLGSIPAHAGKAGPRSRELPLTRVDPRARGEGAPVPRFFDHAGGRSPRTRGRLLQPRVFLRPPGSIPAHAGKAGAIRVENATGGVDPRARGEGLLETARANSDWGRSPRTRGRRREPRHRNAGRGSIPAHAGKARWRSCGRAARRVDPRARGEGLDTPVRATVATGRSPRTRGRRRRGVLRLTRVGSIPAHAGKATRAAPRPTAMRVDPRARGEGRRDPR